MSDRSSNNVRADADFLGILLPSGYNIAKAIPENYSGNIPSYSSNFLIYDSVGMESAHDPADWFHFIVPAGVTKISLDMDASLTASNEYLTYFADLYGPKATLLSSKPASSGFETSGQFPSAGRVPTPNGFTTDWNVEAGDYYVKVETRSSAANESNYSLNIRVREYLTAQPGSSTPNPPTVTKDFGLNFNLNYYLQNNPDVLQALNRGIIKSAAEHYQVNGWKEGRNPNSIFDTKDYLALNPDVAAARLNPLEHFLRYGVYEGRAPNADFVEMREFDWSTYVRSNPDLRLAGIDTAAEAYAHYVLYGEFEARPGAQTVYGAHITNGIPDWY